MRRNSAEFYGTACLVTVGSNTQAMRAARVLSASDIPATVKKTERGGRDGGCSFGVSYPCLYHATVMNVLRDAGIATAEYRNDG